MNWAEKYRPKNVDEIMGHEKFTSDARGWVDNKEMPNVLIYGFHNGTGKTSAAHVIANEILGEHKSTQFLEINASQDRRLDTIRETVTNFASTKCNEDVPFKIILMDELDGMTKDSQRALKRTMEKAYHIRFIITCNAINDIDTAIKSRCANYWFKPLDSDSVLSVLKDISKKEKLTLLYPDLRIFVEAIGGDMRRAINELQAISNSSGTTEFLPLVEKSSVFTSQYERVLDSISIGDDDKALDILLDEVYEGKSIKNITHNLHSIVLNTDKISRIGKYKWLRLLGEMEWRGSNMTPKILVSWFVAQFYE